MRKIISKLLWFLPLYGFIVGFNVVVDPGNFSKSGPLEAQMAALLLEGKPINRPNFNALLFEAEMIRRLPRVRTAVIGTSRSRAIHRSDFPGGTFFNNSFGNACLKDEVALYDTYRSAGKLPRAVVMELSEWMLNVPRCDAWGSQARTAWDFRRWVPKRLAVAFSVPYAQVSARTLIHRWRHRGTVEGLTPLSPDHEVILPDGSQSFTRLSEEPSPEEVRDQVASEVAKADPAKVIRIDPDTVGNIKAFIGRMAADGVKVVIFLPPSHPLRYLLKHQEKSPASFEEVEAEIRSWAGSAPFSVVGSYDPKRCGVGDEDFRDSLHLIDAGMAKIFKKEFTRGNSKRLIRMGLDAEKGAFSR